MIKRTVFLGGKRTAFHARSMLFPPRDGERTPFGDIYGTAPKHLGNTPSPLRQQMERKRNEHGTYPLKKMERIRNDGTPDVRVSIPQGLTRTVLSFHSGTLGDGTERRGDSSFPRKPPGKLPFLLYLFIILVFSTVRNHSVLNVYDSPQEKLKMGSFQDTDSERTLNVR